MTQIGGALAVAVLVFRANDYPLAFLVIVPPVLGALWIKPRWLMMEMLGVAVIASYERACALGAGAW